MKISDVKLTYFSEFCVRFCTWSILSGLLIYFIHTLSFSMSDALYKLGTCLSLLYLSAIFGGLVKDKFFNEKQNIFIGIFLVSIGCFILSTHYFYVGLAVFFIGTGMITPTTPILLANSNKEDINDKTFTIFYGITNSAIILGPIAGGIVAHLFGWNGIIILNELMILCWAISFCFAKWLKEIVIINKNKLLQFLILCIITTYGTYLFLKFENFSKAILTVFMLAYISFLAKLFYQFPDIRKKLLACFIFTTFAIIFFMAEFQVTSS